MYAYSNSDVVLAEQARTQETWKRALHRSHHKPHRAEQDGRRSTSYTSQ